MNIKPIYIVKAGLTKGWAEDCYHYDIIAFDTPQEAEERRKMELAYRKSIMDMMEKDDGTFEKYCSDNGLNESDESYKSGEEVWVDVLTLVQSDFARSSESPDSARSSESF